MQASKQAKNVLKKYRKDAVVAGFRKGKTPMAIINKKYRTSVIVEEVNKLLQDELYKHISAEKVRVLGSPMPVDETPIDWENTADFTFEYEVGLAPDFDVKITAKDKLNYYHKYKIYTWKTHQRSPADSRTPKFSP